MKKLTEEREHPAPVNLFVGSVSSSNMVSSNASTEVSSNESHNVSNNAVTPTTVPFTPNAADLTAAASKKKSAGRLEVFERKALKR